MSIDFNKMLRESKPIDYNDDTIQLDNELVKKQVRSNSNKFNIEEVIITTEFETILNKLNHTNESIFLTGKPGTGKSTLLKYFLATTAKNAIVLAPTGVAALNIGGQTLHSFFGFGFGPQGEELEAGCTGMYREKKQKVVRNSDILIIDEISMVRSDMLDGVDQALRFMNNDPETPFGGLQVLFIGDLYQLPPVTQSEDLKWLEAHDYRTDYFFGAKIFTEFNINIFELTENQRQKNDLKFIDLLERIRVNKMTMQDLNFLNSRVMSRDNNDASTIVLCGRNRTAEAINKNEFDLIQEEVFTSNAYISGKVKEKEFKHLLTIQYKVGMRVMNLVNDYSIDTRNGMLGTVTDIDRNNGIIYVVFDDRPDEELGITIYSWEVVENTYNNETKKVERNSIGSIDQYPLSPAWAITIHKSQGKTFKNIHLNLGGKAFAHGQTYVALSRCTSLDGITIETELTKRDIIVDEIVNEFFNGEFTTIGNNPLLTKLEEKIFDIIYTTIDEGQAMIREDMIAEIALEATSRILLVDFKRYIKV